jgi:hypothetical protein
MALGKRGLGRPLKYNIRTARNTGFLDLVFNPRSKWEMAISKSWRVVMPYLAQWTYRCHVEGARDGGFRIHDIHGLKFWKEPYLHLHLYA